MRIEDFLDYIREAKSKATFKNYTQGLKKLHACIDNVISQFYNRVHHHPMHACWKKFEIFGQQSIRFGGYVSVCQGFDCIRF